MIFRVFQLCTLKISVSALTSVFLWVIVKRVNNISFAKILDDFDCEGSA